MSDKENFLQEVGSPTDDPQYSVTSRDLPLQNVSQASMFENPPFLQSQFPFTINARNLQTSHFAKSVNNEFLNKEPGDHLNFRKTSPSSQKVLSGVSGSGRSSSKPVENKPSMIENPYFLQSQFPFMTRARNVQTSDVAKSVNNEFLNKEPNDRLDFGITTRFPQKGFSEAVGSGRSSSKPVEYMAPMIENPYFLRSRPPFTTHTRIVQTSDVAKGVNNAFLNKEPGDRLDFGITTRFPHKIFPEASGSGATSSNPVEHMAPMIENPYFLRSRPPFKTQARIVPTFESTMNVGASSDRENLFQFRSSRDNFVDYLPSYEGNTDKQFKNGYLSSDEIENMRQRSDGLLPSGLSGNLHKVDQILSHGREDIRSENALSSSGKYQYISDITPLDTTFRSLALSEGINPQLRNPNFIGEIDGSFPSQREEKHFENYLPSKGKIEEHYIPNTPVMANQCLAIRETNDKQVRYLDFTDQLSLHNSSSKYLQLYNKTLPENYDFAMNIMAYIEHLNDCSWKGTISYFDEYVKRMFKHLWNGIKDSLNSKTESITFDQSTFLIVLDEYTHGAKCGEYELCKFLNYCVIMSQLGVIARKRDLKDAPMYVVMFLRSAIQEVQISQSILLEIVVKEFAEDLVKVLKL